MSPDNTNTTDISSKRRIGWREWVVLPELAPTRINAKIDTGAKSSAIHAIDIKEIEKGRALWVSFFLCPVQQKSEPEIYCRAPVTDKRTIRSSNGQEEDRYVVRTPIKIGDRAWPIDLTLANRDAMEFRLLLGRDALQHNFLIDPGASYMLDN